MAEVNTGRRQFLTATTSFIAGAGVAGIAVPFIQSWNPSARAKAAGAPVKVDLSKLEPGAMVLVEWQGKPVFVLRHTETNLKNLTRPEHRDALRDPDSTVNQQPDYARNAYRSKRPGIFVAVGVCTHLGCIPLYEPDGIVGVDEGLYFCPCHGSKFDLAGRVYKGVPAPTNLIIPPYRYLTDTVVEIGVDETTAAPSSA